MCLADYIRCKCLMDGHISVLVRKLLSQYYLDVQIRRIQLIEWSNYKYILISNKRESRKSCFDGQMRP